MVSVSENRVKRAWTVVVSLIILSRTDFGEVLKVETCLKEVQKPKEGLANILNKSNPTVEANMCLQNVFEQDSQQNR